MPHAYDVLAKPLRHTVHSCLRNCLSKRTCEHQAPGNARTTRRLARSPHEARSHTSKIDIRRAARHARRAKPVLAPDQPAYIGDEFVVEGDRRH
ncbi:hypothetical protein WOLCODRAFT_29717 [Wolfiporia cocos MD-104 SS10]|uniref:Uncharacterized protein n=1 Tax=Wolfiporia cocos (strain MD-104) TaxID=742152 RepID=A0A2H3K824_WOLCO|nr:hypothetical protein WOLCODRAFT_29717 [Wolfiporia cocos MD-104 SS10]